MLHRMIHTLWNKSVHCSELSLLFFLYQKFIQNFICFFLKKIVNANKTFRIGFWLTVTSNTDVVAAIFLFGIHWRAPNRQVKLIFWQDQLGNHFFILVICFRFACTTCLKMAGAVLLLFLLKNYYCTVALVHSSVERQNHLSRRSAILYPSKLECFFC